MADFLADLLALFVVMLAIIDNLFSFRSEKRRG